MFAGWFAVILCTVPGTLRWGPYLVASIVFSILVAVFFARRYVLHRPSRWLLLLMVSVVLTIPFVVIVRAFGEFDVLAFVFHAQFGIDGTTLAGFEYEVLEAVVAVLALALIGVGLGSIWQLQRLAAILASAVVLALNPAVRFAEEYLGAEAIDSNLHSEIRQPVIATVAETLPDIIVVYMEGLERIYADRDRYGDIYAPLERYAEGGVAFTQIKQVKATGWSLAGIVASQCGLPLLPNGFRNKYRFHEQVDFMSEQTCLSDVTHALGYNNAFVFGGEQVFGGMNHLFRSHEYHRVVDVHSIADLVPATDFEASRLTDFLDMQFILDDAVVFDAAVSVHDQLLSEQMPFLLTVETFGPHGSSSVLSRNCTSSGRAQATGNVTAAISCTLTDMAPFLNHVARHRNGRPAIVVLLSDHLNHDVALSVRVPRNARSNTVILFPIGGATPPVPSGTTISRPGSMMDVYPSILAYAGLTELDGRGGLGVSLFGEEETLLEMKGMEQLNAELFPNVALARSIWAVGTQ